MPDADELPPPAAELIGRARQFRLNGSVPVPPRPAATVVVLRDGEQGLETFMLRRVAAMAFAAGMHVFPGGVVDPSDRSCPGLADPVTAAAIRETFEETGLLLASGSAVPAELQAALEADRLALLAHEAGLGEVLDRHGLVPRADALHRWSHWITPEFEPRRYDTVFFVAALRDDFIVPAMPDDFIVPAMPDDFIVPAMRDGDQARDLGGESDAAGWVTPADALAAAARGEWLLMLPTVITLRELLPYRRAVEVVEAAAHRNVRPIRATIDLDADPPAYAFHSAGGG